MLVGVRDASSGSYKMALLSAFGIDHTILIQFGIFSLAFFTLTFALFKPYTDAFEQRESRTTGGEQAAEETVKKAGELRLVYEARAREVNSEIKKIFDSYREEAHHESQKIISRARSEAQQLLDQTRQRVSLELDGARQKLHDEVPAMAQIIVAKLLAKKA
jgi:F0F1-type ATP synthase membrane subunit b/b'